MTKVQAALPGDGISSTNLRRAFLLALTLNSATPCTATSTGRKAFGAVIFGLLFGLSVSSNQAPLDISKSESWQIGVVVEEVGRGSALENAGIQSGDVLLFWKRLPNPPANPDGAQGEIGSVFDWLWMVREQAPRGIVKIIGEREGNKKVFEVRIGLWRAKVRANMSPALLKGYLRGRELLETEDLEQGVSLWQKVVARAQGRKNGLLTCWLYLRIGEIWAAERSWANAYIAYRSALSSTQRPIAQMAVWEAMGKGYELQNNFIHAETSYRSLIHILPSNWDESLVFAAGFNNLEDLAWRSGELELAEEYSQRVLEIRKRLAPASLAVARSLSNLGRIALVRSQLMLAASLHQQALEIRERLAPSSLDVADSLDNLGQVAETRGRLNVAAHCYQQALEIRERLAPASLDEADSLNRLGMMLLWKGRLRAAKKHIQKALEIRKQLAPASLWVAESLDSMGFIVGAWGETDLTGVYFNRATEIRERLAPKSHFMADSLTHLGYLAQFRGEFNLARGYYLQALEIRERLVPASLHTANSLISLGEVAEAVDKLSLAEDYYQKALETFERLAPKGLSVSIILNHLGAVALRRGELDLAAEYHERALEILEMLNTRIQMDHSFYGLGRVAQDRGDLNMAALYYQRALQLREQLGFGRLVLAQSLNTLGIVARDRGQLGLAMSFFRRSIDALEAQAGKLGGTQHVKGKFRAQYEYFYRDFVEFLLQMNRPEEAFSILERSRARSLLAMLAQRDLKFSIPDGIAEARRKLALRYDEAQRQMAYLSRIDDQENLEGLRQKLARLQQKRANLIERVRRECPQFAALIYPQSKKLREVQEGLDPGTVILYYSVGKEQTYLFVVTSDQVLGVHTLAISEADLQEEVKNFRKLIEQTKPDTPLAPMSMSGLEILGNRLFLLLVEPAAEMVESNDRVLIIPDGPLHLLPFAALIRKTKGALVSSDGQYFAEWKPLHVVLSATVYAELKKTRRGTSLDNGAGPLLAAFGDPHFSMDSWDTPENSHRISTSDVQVRAPWNRSLFGWDRLPESRREILEISGLYQNVQIYLGEGATEERVKALDGATRIVHFATHGHLDHRFPLNSGLVLTRPEGSSGGRDNGILQAWEIFESVRLDADLVVLSACESGLGEEQRGEGLVGLARAFQYAGARTVAATLWQVDDRVTAELMVRFYRHLRVGKPKDVALQAAQVELIRRPIEVREEDGRVREIDAFSPYYWAAFQIIGDWR